MRLMQRTRLFLAALLLAIAAPLSHAGAFGDTTENELIDHLLRGQTLTIGSQSATWGTAPELYVALGTACSDSAFTELAATGSYARVRIPAAGAPSLTSGWSGTQSNSSTTASSGTGGTSYNLATVTFPTATADWNSAATIGFWALYDASSSGTVIVCAALTTARAVTNGATASFAAAALSLQVDN
jgi:hypothetical protein